MLSLICLPADEQRPLLAMSLEHHKKAPRLPRKLLGFF